MTSVNKRELSPILISINFRPLFIFVDNNNIVQTHFINKCCYAQNRKVKPKVDR